MKDIPESVRNDVEFVPVSNMDQVLHHALVEHHNEISSEPPSSVH